MKKSSIAAVVSLGRARYSRIGREPDAVQTRCGHQCRLGAGQLRNDADDRRRLPGDGPRGLDRRLPDPLGAVLRVAVEQDPQEEQDPHRPGRYEAAGHGFGALGRAPVRVQLEHPRPCRPSRQPGGPGHGRSLQEWRSRHRHRLGDPRHADACARREAARHAQGLLLPDGPERRAAGRPRGGLDRWKAEGEARLHHRRRGELQHGPRRPGAAQPAVERRPHRQPRPREPERVRLLVGHHPHPG